MARLFWIAPTLTAVENEHGSFLQVHRDWLRFWEFGGTVTHPDTSF
jgi:hypothetical protein